MILLQATGIDEKAINVGDLILFSEDTTCMSDDEYTIHMIRRMILPKVGVFLGIIDNKCYVFDVDRNVLSDVIMDLRSYKVVSRIG